MITNQSEWGERAGRTILDKPDDYWPWLHYNQFLIQNLALSFLKNIFWLQQHFPDEKADGKILTCIFRYIKKLNSWSVMGVSKDKQIWDAGEGQSFQGIHLQASHGHVLLFSHDPQMDS